MSAEVREFFDGLYYVLAERKDYCVEFVIFESDYEVDKTNNDVFLSGYIKWDGCSNWDFENKNYPLHFCSRSEIKRLSNLFIMLYDWALELMPENEFYLKDD